MINWDAILWPINWFSQRKAKRQAPEQPHARYRIVKETIDEHVHWEVEEWDTHYAVDGPFWQFESMHKTEEDARDRITFLLIPPPVVTREQVYEVVAPR